MKFCATVLALVAIFARGDAFPTWPSAIDELEDVMFLNTGYKSRGFSAHVTPCEYSEFKAGRQTAAEFIRMGFHDMATTNIFFPPQGGIDASMVFEFTNGENLGAGFKTTLNIYGGLYNGRLSMADMIALGVYTSVRACGGPAVPMRGGRIDATAAGPAGVPQPQNSLGTFINQFARMGFNTTEMIQLVACGHTMGGVHGDDFPTIVVPNSAPNNFVLFDNTPAFDSQIAVRYVSGPNTDPLSVGPSRSVGRNMDTVVFNADKNVTIGGMVSPAAFNSQCSTILQKMIETVDPSITTLSGIIQPYEVKPSGIQLTLLSDGAQMTFSGDIRVRTTVRSASQITSVQVVYKNAAGGTGGTISTTVSGTANGFDDTFTFYGFSAAISTTTSISSFIVLVTATSGTVSTYDNNALGFPMQDSVIVQLSQSCVSGGLNVVAAVRSSVTTPVVLSVTEKIPRASPIPVPSLLSNSVTMTAGSTLGLYTFYNATYAISQVTGAKFDVSSGSFTDAFKDVSALATACATAPPKVLGHKANVGAYNFQGCYTEANGMRALSDKSTVNGTSMSIEYCASFCSGYKYFGVEYHEECYCGNTLASTSTLAALSDCYHVCPGDSYEYCGAGNRLELYLLSTAASSSQVSSSPSSSTTSISTMVTSTSKQPSSTSIRFSSSSIVSSVLSSSHSSSKVLSSSSVRTSSFRSSSSTSSVKPSSSTLKSSSSSSVTPSSSTVKLSSSSVNSSSSTSKSTSSSAPTPSSSLKSSSSSSSSSSSASSSSSFKSTSTSVKSSTSSVLSSSSSSSKSSSSSNALSSSSSIRISSSTSKSSVPSSTSSTTSSTPSAAPTLHIVPSAGGYSYYGCYSEATNGRALTLSSTAADTLTIESCVAYCAQSGALFAGAEYGRECYCGNSFAAGSVLKPDSDCYFTCAGTPYEYCGAGNRLTVMALNAGGNTGSSSSSSPSSPASSSGSASSSKSSSSSSTTSSPTVMTPTTPSQTAPGIKPTIGAYTYLGCQTEGNGIRALTGNSITNYNTMTLENCASFCGATANGGPFKYWGVEYGGECYCGNVFNGGSTLAPDTDCYFACPAAQFEYCGAGNRLSAYTLT